MFEERATVGLLPIQHALAGMNAHIEHDLPIAVVETCRVRRTSPGATGVRQDYERVNDVLAAVESEIRRSFLTAIGRRVDEEIGAVVHLVNAWNIDKARDLAWVNVETLWTMRELELLYGRYVGMLGHTVGMGSRILLTPWPAASPRPGRAGCLDARRACTMGSLSPRSTTPARSVGPRKL